MPEKAKEENEEEKELQLLSKTDILEMKDKTESVRLDHYERDVVIRPLTDGELTKVFELIGNVPLNEQGLPDLNLVDISTNLRALRLIASMGMVEPKMSEEEISEMRFGTPGFLAKKILELSGLSGAM